jgi:hypothetical protein
VSEAAANLLNRPNKSPRTAADIKQPQFTLIPASKDFAELRQNLPADRVRCAVKEYFDLGIISLGGILRHPAARLEMKILQIIARSFSARFLSQDLRFSVTLPASVNIGEVLEEKPRPVKERRQRPIMIERQRVKPGLDIGEILQEKRSHIGVDLIAIRDRQIGTGTALRFLPLLAPRGLGKPAQGKTVPNVPGDARQLASTIGNAPDKIRKWAIHTSPPSLNCITYIRLIADISS